MNIIIARVAIDFGLVVLIWMVHLIIYPSFQQFSQEKLKKWHPRYRKQITLLVAPLSFAQIGIISYQLFFIPSFYSFSSAILCLICWILTFYQAVPLHNKIESDSNSNIYVQKLIAVRWKRTLVWTLIFILTIVELLNQ